MGKWFNETLLNENFVIKARPRIKEENAKNLDSTETAEEGIVSSDSGNEDRPQCDSSLGGNRPKRTRRTRKVTARKAGDN